MDPVVLRGKFGREMRPRPSASCETCRPLLQERRDAFTEIGGPRGDALQVALEIELPVEGVAGAGGERLLDERQRPRRLARETRGEGTRLRHQRLILDDAPDKAPFGRLRGGQRLAE